MLVRQKKEKALNVMEIFHHFWLQPMIYYLYKNSTQAIKYAVKPLLPTHKAGYVNMETESNGCDQKEWKVEIQRQILWKVDIIMMKRVSLFLRATSTTLPASMGFNVVIILLSLSLFLSIFCFLLFHVFILWLNFYI